MCLSGATGLDAIREPVVSSDDKEVGWAGPDNRCSNVRWIVRKWTVPRHDAQDCSTSAYGATLSLELQFLQIAAELFAQVRALERKLYCGFEESELVAGVVALAFVYVRVDFFFLQQKAHSVGELELAARPQLSFCEHIEYCGREDVAAGNGQVGGGFFRLGLLDHVLDLK